ncbi:AAA family ATPase [Amycolatopsis sacchari]|uniref:helix-turn-helix transcriptional regulator n=1 Tax=Amycolatopsis sacchari TaxID=115433 RepID=UPI003EC0A47D
MARDRLRGRRTELAALRAAVRGDRGRLVVVRGAAGTGKTALLRAAAAAWQADGARVIRLPPADGANPVRLLVDAVRAEFEQVGDAVVAERIATLTRRCETGPCPTAFPALTAIFDRIGRTGPTVLVADDADAPAAVLGAARRPGCLVVAACRDAPELLAAADEVLELGPLPEADLAPLLARAAGGLLDEAVPQALAAALGPLAGNPGAAIATVAELRRRGRLVRVGDRLCLADPVRPIALPPGHDLPARAGEAGLRLLAVVSALGSLRIDDLPVLAEVLGERLDPCGRLVDRLVEAGMLTAAPDGSLTCEPPALAAAAVEQVPVHAECAEFTRRLLAGNRTRVLAEYASRARPPLDPGEVSWLVAEADAIAAREPGRAVRWYAAALEQPGAAAAQPAALAEFLRLVVATGRYELLPDLDAAALPAELRHDLLVAQLLAVAHLGSLPPNAKRWWFAAVARIGERLPPVRQLRAQPVLSPGELTLLGHALLGDRDGCARTAARLRRRIAPETLDALAEAGNFADLATVLELLLGPRYRVPSHGPVAVYQRLLAQYRAGDWTSALSAARELAAGNETDSAGHQIAHLIAAEICTARGQLTAARRWLDPVPEGGALEAMRVWGEVGLLLHLGEYREAVGIVQRLLDRLAGRSRYGLDQLLRRALVLAHRAGDTAAAQRFLAELERQPRSLAVLQGRAFAHRDPVLAAEAADLARARGDVPDQLVALLVAAEIAEDPEPVLREAHELVDRCGAVGLRRIFQRPGLSAPQPRAGRTELSETELRIIELLREGYTNRRVASLLGVTVKTVENHLTRLFARTGCRSRVELVAASLQGRFGPAA